MKLSKFDLVICWFANIFYWPVVVTATVYGVLYVVEYFGLLELIK